MNASRPPYAARRSALAAALAPQALDALLITDLINIRYLTGFTGSNAALLVGPTDATTVFCTDGRYTTQAATEVPDLQTVIDRQSATALTARAHGRVGFEAAQVSVHALSQLVAASADGVELVPTTDQVEQLRAVKDAGEIESLRRACAVGDQALAELIAAGGIRIGRTEREVGLDLDQRMRLLGAGNPAFETIVAAGANSAIPHHSPTAAVLAAGDFVKLDFGAEVDGYHSDMTRTFVLGTPAAWQQEIYGLVSAAQQAGCVAAVVGATGGEIDAAARDVITEAGYGDQFAHGLGHGVGLAVHEGPSLSKGAAGMICADMCVTVEPGVYLPGRGGVRIEDSGVVRGQDHSHPGYEVLTLTSKDLVEL